MVVTFDGSSDAGQIDGVYGHDATGAETALPAARVKLADLGLDSLAIMTEACNPREVIDSLADGLCERVHSR